MNLPKITHPHIGSGPKANFYHIEVSDDYSGTRFWFSYDTCIAVERTHYELLIRKNDWQQTTGKHLNFINPDKSIRVDGDEFEKQLKEM